MTGRILHLPIASKLVFCAVLFAAANGVFGAETNAAVTPDNKTAMEDARNWAIVTNSLLQMREEGLMASRAAEKARQEADASAKQSADAIKARLNLLEQSLQAQAQRDLETFKSWNRFMLVIGAALGGVGLLGLVFIAFFLLRTMNRLTDVMSVLGTGQQLGHARSLAALGVGPAHLDRPGPAEQSSTRLFGAIERLERQIHDLEHLAKLPAAENETNNHFGEPKAHAESSPSHSAGALETRAAAADQAARIALVLGKAQTLLNLKQPEEALACFDEVLAIDPHHHEALVKRGTALERLGRMDEAIESYDRAIAADQFLTTAYLCKGGVFNRLGRHDEALHCYEQALRTQEKAGLV